MGQFFVHVMYFKLNVIVKKIGTYFLSIINDLSSCEINNVIFESYSVVYNNKYTHSAMSEY